MEEKVRINKYISSTGFCSRREADRLIEEGKVLINGKRAIKGTMIGLLDEIRVNGQLLGSKEQPVYIAFNKPRGIICTTDRRIKGNIIDFINYSKRIFHVGRLDKDSQGLILLTNDGDIVNKILRASNNHEKEYIVTVDKEVTTEFIRNMSKGVPILNTITKDCKVWKISKYIFKIVLTQGLNRQIRRMCEYFGYNVVKLERIRIMNITLKNLPLGKWRYLTPHELKILNKFISSDKNSIK
ncbi:MAG TPA: 23S rRNA pseudouridine(2604) synthase RluF [Eubacteriaceae bacterium]|jgi:23S rRNA pseudouridine2604 synthase|nr:23S rRNA pseudouridine(2604) synthase RluF [Eubacteriaceae bacterium]